MCHLKIRGLIIMEKDAIQNKTINAYPTKELFISILTRDVTLRDAIGDLLDNSIDGALRLRPDNNYQGLYVKIGIDVKQNFFKIEDNCGGIPVSIARNYAFRFGRPEGAEKTEHSVGVFGIGMKRALFRLGKKFEIISTTHNSSFTMEVDVEEWKKENTNEGNQADWTFMFNDLKEDMEQEFPENERGTSITVTELHQNVIETFEQENDITILIKELQREHLFSIDNKLEITINGILLKSQELKLAASDFFKTAYYENSEGQVKVKIYAGIGEQEKYGDNGGWYIFCNKRLVIGPDQTKITGWGIKTPIRIPEYHSQFYRFRGYAFLDAKDPKELPWNTAKTGMDLDSPIYRSVRLQMINLMRSVMDFLNKLHEETKAVKHDKIDETPLQKAIDQSPIMELHEAIGKRDNLAKLFGFPEPAKSKQSISKQVWIRYAISNKEYEHVKEYFETDKQGDIGRRTFDYFFEREIES